MSCGQHCVSSLQTSCIDCGCFWCCLSRTLDRQKVLLHHPDKQDQDNLMGDDHFKCIKIG